MPLGIDLEVFGPDRKAGGQVRRRLGWEKDGPPVVGFLGRFVPEKGAPLLARVLDCLATSWRALFVGGGPLEKYLSNWAVRHGDRVRVVTGVKHDEVPGYLNAMDVLCAPSQTKANWREQQGRMLIEAFACGVPVVASDSGEIPHVVRDAGVIVGEKDEAGWVQALAGLLENPSRRGELSARGLERAHAVYAWSVIARQHLDFFAELMDNRRSTAV
jgi:glycosyltransferase involved in cell wall biosynthesis